MSEDEHARPVRKSQRGSAVRFDDDVRSDVSLISMWLKYFVLNLFNELQAMCIAKICWLHVQGRESMILKKSITTLHRVVFKEDISNNWFFYLIIMLKFYIVFWDKKYSTLVKMDELFRCTVVLASCPLLRLDFSVNGIVSLGSLACL